MRPAVLSRQAHASTHQLTAVHAPSARWRSLRVFAAGLMMILGVTVVALPLAARHASWDGIAGPDRLPPSTSAGNAAATPSGDAYTQGRSQAASDHGLAVPVPGLERLSVSLQIAARRCQRPLAQHEALYNEDVMIRGYASPALLEHAGEQVYRGERRHPGAFYYSDARGAFIGRRERDVEIEVPAQFIESVLAHLSEGLTRGYARSLFMADWGHGHLLVPQDEYRRALEGVPEFSGMPYGVLLRSENMVAIYHSAEQMLKVVGGRPVEDARSRHYIERRNIVGSFGPAPEIAYLPPERGDPHNTQRDLEGYRQYGGIEFTWNRNACFPVLANDRVVYVDLSFETPPLRRPPMEAAP
jgi:hypothetical protein